jgi:hypothetical protein
MSNKHQMVVLVMVPESSPLAELYGKIVEPVKMEAMYGEQHFLRFQFQCTIVQDDNSVYLTIVLSEPEDFRGLKLGIPHSSISLIVHSSEQKILEGFGS